MSRDNRRRGWLSKISLSLCIVIAIWLAARWDSSQPPVYLIEEKTDAETGEEIDLYLQGVLIKEFDQDGIMRSQINASSASKYQTYSNFIEPYFTIPNANKTWSVSANKARMDNAERIELSEQVIVRQDQPKMTLRTESLIFERDQQILSSHDKVSISTDDFTQTAIGFYGQISTGHYRFEQQVNSIYEHQKK